MPPMGDGLIADDHEVRLGAVEEVWWNACEALDAWRMFPEWAEVVREEVKRANAKPDRDDGDAHLRPVVGESVPDSTAR